eukprot:1961280-Rhodomonas_salina.1
MSGESIGSEVSISSSVAAPEDSGSKGKMAGIGLTFTRADGSGGLPVKRVKDDGPAAVEGSLKPGDVVLSIDG